MKVKLFSAIADEDFRALYTPSDLPGMSANDYLEHQIQVFLDGHPNVAVRHLQYFATAIPGKRVSDWEIEKSVILLYDDPPLR